MSHDHAKNEGVVERGGTEAFDVTFYNKDPSVGGIPTNPDGYNPGAGPSYNDPSGFVTPVIQIYDTTTSSLGPTTGYIPPTLSNLRYSGSTGQFLVDVSVPANSTLSATLPTGKKWALSWTTTIGTVTITGTDAAEILTVVDAGAVSFGDELYCEAEDVAKFVTANGLPIDANSAYTTELIEHYIKVAMSEIENITRRTWRARVVEDEEQPPQFNLYGNVWTGYYAAIRTLYYPIRSIQKIQVLRGADYVDITVDEGRKGKWYADYKRGTVLVREIIAPHTSQNKILISYTAGEKTTDMPYQIKMATIIRASWYMLQSDDYTVLLPEGTTNIPIDIKAREWDSKFSELVMPVRNGLVWR